MSRQVSIEEGASLLRQGAPLVFPTDTVFGLGVAPRYSTGPGELFRLKGRASDKPVAWLVPSVESLGEWGTAVPDWAWELARVYWPGALTLVVRASAAVPAAFASAEGTIGLRMPASPTALKLMELAESPLAATSANISGEPAAACAADLDPRLLAQVAFVEGLEQTEGAAALASTVVDCTGPCPKVLRQGPVAFLEL